MTTPHIPKENDRLFYCQDDGGQWNMPVEIVSILHGLVIVRGLDSDLVACIGNDGHKYLIVKQEELYDARRKM